VRKKCNFNFGAFVGFIVEISYLLSSGRRDKVAVWSNNTQCVVELLTRPYMSKGRTVVMVRGNLGIKQLRQITVSKIKQL
jgi:hypothetical protein